MKLLGIMIFVSGSVFGSCYTNHYDVDRKVNNGDSIGVRVARGDAEQVAVRWHDDVGSEHKARGRVYLDRNILGEDDIEADGNTSVFSARMRTNGDLSIQILKDDAKIKWVEVTYCDGGNPPPPRSDWRYVEEDASNLDRAASTLYRDGDYEARRGTQYEQRAADDMRAFSSDARNFYSEVSRTTRDNSYVRNAYNKLQNSFSYLSRSMRDARFSSQVNREFDACVDLMERLRRDYQ